ncbi:MAG: hypothetical protein D6800_09915 [Candidatus Zixiibacteriota bacterium]|nr:MAG: hypothetical protein D6800_09915 [candidate division Zixibacteria bacterium]
MAVAADLNQRNLNLLALASMSEQGDNQTQLQVGELTDAVCRQLNLPARERLFITTAAYLLNLGGRYYDTTGSGSDRRKGISLTVRLLSALGYPTEVCDILDTAYTDLPADHTEALPLSLLGGNIITVVDRYVSLQQVEAGSSVDRFEAIQQEFTELEGVRYLPEVTKAFTEVMRERRLDETGSITQSQVLLFGPVAEKVTPLAERLRADGFRTVAVYDVDSFVELYHRSLPDIIVILSTDERQGTLDLLDGLTARNVDMTRTPSVLVTSGTLLREPDVVLDRGLTDVLPPDDPLNLLGMRLRRFRDNSRPAAPKQTNAEVTE